MEENLNELKQKAIKSCMEMFNNTFYMFSNFKGYDVFKQKSLPLDVINKIVFSDVRKDADFSSFKLVNLKENLAEMLAYNINILTDNQKNILRDEKDFYYPIIKQILIEEEMFEDIIKLDKICS